MSDSSTRNAPSFRATIIRELTQLEAKFDKLSPDSKSNQGRLISRAFVWDLIQDYAKKQSDVAWEVLESEEVFDAPIDYPEGDHTLTESPNFSVQLKVSKPRKQFDADVLAEALKKRFKVPVPTTKELVEKAKMPGNPTRTFKIVER